MPPTDVDPSLAGPKVGQRGGRDRDTRVPSMGWKDLQRNECAGHIITDSSSRFILVRLIDSLIVI